MKMQLINIEIRFILHSAVYELVESMTGCKYFFDARSPVLLVSIEFDTVSN